MILILLFIGGAAALDIIFGFNHLAGGPTNI
jgi:hypothetical protein